MFLRQTFRTLIITGLTFALLSGVSSASLLEIVSTQRGQININILPSHVDMILGSISSSSSGCHQPLTEPGPTDPGHEFSEQRDQASMSPSGFSFAGNGGPSCTLIRSLVIPKNYLFLGWVTDLWRDTWPSPPIWELLKVPIQLKTQSIF